MRFAMQNEINLSTKSERCFSFTLNVNARARTTRSDCRPDLPIEFAFHQVQFPVRSENVFPLLSSTRLKPPGHRREAECDSNLPVPACDRPASAAIRTRPDHSESA